MRTILLSTISFASLSLLGIRSLNASSCGCGGGTSKAAGGTVPAGLSVIYTDATTNIGTSPGSGVTMVTEEFPATHANEKPQGGLGLTALLTDPVSGNRPSTARTRHHWVKGGSGSPLQNGHVEAALEIEASSTDVYHPLEVSYASGGSAYTTDHREHMLVSPPAGHYLITNLTARDSGTAWETRPTNVIANPVSSGATFFRVAFVSERGNEHHQPGEFTFPSLALEENMTNGTSALGDPVTSFSFYLGNDMASGAKQGRSWGRLTSRVGLLGDVGAHQLRFVTSHSKVDDGGSPLVDEIINATSRIYQIKTADVLLDVREVVTDNRGTSSNYSDDLRKVTIRLTTAADAGTPDGNGIYPEPSAPIYGTVLFDQTERSSNGFVFKTTFKQYAPGVSPAPGSVIATFVYSAENIVAGEQNKLTINRDSLETEAIENWLISAATADNHFPTTGPVRMETRHTHIGATASGNLLDTSRAMYEVISRGEQLIRTEQGSANGSALASTSWASTDCLEWTKYKYDGDTGRVMESENRRGEWSQQYFRQDTSFYTGGAPSHYGTLAEGDRFTISISPEKATTDSLSTHVSSGHALVTRHSVATTSSDSYSKAGVPVMQEERNKGKIVALNTTATSIVGSGTGATLRMAKTDRTNPNAGTPSTLVTTNDAYLMDNTDYKLRGRVFLKEEPGAKGRTAISNPDAKIIQYKNWAEPSTGTLTTLDSASESDPTGRPTKSIQKVVSVTSGSSSTTEQGEATSTTIAYTNDGTTPSISIVTTTRDSLQIAQTKYDPALRKRTEISAEGVITETLYDALGRPTKSTRTAAVGIAALVTHYDYESRSGGGRVQRVRRGTDTATVLVSEQAHDDNAGRLVSSKDSAGLATSYTYTLNGSNQLVVTETMPNTATRITTSGADGEVISITGTGVVAQTFENVIVGQTGDTVTPPSWITTAQSLTDFRRRSVKTGSARWQHTVTDGLGRTVAVWGSGKEERHVYNSTTGRLEKIEHGAPTVSGTSTTLRPLLYEYDALGRVVKTGYSLEATDDGTLTAGSGSGTDRVRLHAESIVQIGGSGPWWRKTEEQYYKNNGSGADIITETTTHEALKVDSTNKILSETRMLSADGAEERSQTKVNTTNIERYTLTTRPGQASNTATTTYKNGVLYSSNTLSVQEPVIYYYDQYGRPTGQRDPMTARSTVTEYNAQGQVSRTVDLAGNSTFYLYHTGGEAGAGRVEKITHADGAYVVYAYDAHYRVTGQTGSADYPVAYAYDSTDGWMTTMKTYRDTASAGNMLTGTSTYESVTTWTYETATGLLTDKTDHNSKSTSYTYWTGTHLLKERKWARTTGGNRVTTTYGYDAAGQLVTTSYNDGTSTVTRTYDRAGREATRQDDAGLTTFTRNNAGLVTNETTSATSGISGDPEILNGYTATRTVNSYGQLTGVDAYWTNILTANSGATTGVMTYNSATGRLVDITNGSSKHTYSYATNSDLITSRMCTMNSTDAFEQQYGYDEAGRLNFAGNKQVGGAMHAAYYYTYDDRNQRTQALREDGIKWDYYYDDRGQVTGAEMKRGNDYLPGRMFTYFYDAIGNRTSMMSGGDYQGTNQRTISYTRNALNQYTAITNPVTFDVNGRSRTDKTISLALGTGSYSNVGTDGWQPQPPGSGWLASRWHKELSAAGSSDTIANWETVNVKEDSTVVSTGLTMLPPETQSPTYDDDGNMTFDGTWVYAWDAENRLISMELTTLPQGTGAPTVYRRLEFSYDGLSRRIQKKVLERPNSMSSWSQVKAYRYGYEGWNATIRATYSGSAWVGDQYYVWGLDLSGSWQGAGGVGGLLATYIEGAGRRFIGYDGNGNVTSLMYPNDGVLHALYEYDAFGNPTRHTSLWGTLAEDNPWRFSTKTTDDETGLVYYGYRYYAPGLGRWIKRDTIEESGGENLVGFVENNATNQFDSLGLESAEQCALRRWAEWERANSDLNARIANGTATAADLALAVKAMKEIRAQCMRERPNNCHALTLGGVGNVASGPPTKPCVADQQNTVPNGEKVDENVTAIRDGLKAKRCQFQGSGACNDKGCVKIWLMRHDVLAALFQRPLAAGLQDCWMPFHSAAISCADGKCHSIPGIGADEEVVDGFANAHLRDGRSTYDSLIGPHRIKVEYWKCPCPDANNSTPENTPRPTTPRPNNTGPAAGPNLRKM